MESIGIRIEQIPAQTLACPAGERVFIEALALFWKYFEAGCLFEFRLKLCPLVISDQVDLAHHNHDRLAAKRL